jgi:hypothetical protein
MTSALRCPPNNGAASRRKHPILLAIAALAMLAWMLFLGWMAL